MVNLIEQRRQAAADRSRASSSRTQHNWSQSTSRQQEDMNHRSEPTSLAQLERLTQRSIKLMEKRGHKTENSYFEAMDILRQQYNLNFMILCNKCIGLHAHDEVLAPER